MLFFLGTFSPIIVLIAVFVLAGLLKGKGRWVTLLFGPLGVFGVAWLIGQKVAANGNLLYVAVFGVVFVGLFAYYPILGIIGFIKFLRKRKTNREVLKN